MRQEAWDMGTVRGMDGWAPYRKETHSCKVFQYILLLANPYTTATHLYKRETKSVCEMHLFLFFYTVRENYSSRYEVVLTGSKRRVWSHWLACDQTSPLCYFSMSPEETTLMSTASPFFFSFLPHWGSLGGKGAQGKVWWCNEFGHGEKRIKQNGRWR